MQTYSSRNTLLILLHCFKYDIAGGSEGVGQMVQQMREQMTQPAGNQINQPAIQLPPFGPPGPSTIDTTQTSGQNIDGGSEGIEQMVRQMNQQMNLPPIQLPPFGLPGSLNASAAQNPVHNLGHPGRGPPKGTNFQGGLQHPQDQPQGNHQRLGDHPECQPQRPSPSRVQHPSGGGFDVGAFAALAGLGAPGEQRPHQAATGDLAAILGSVVQAPGPLRPTISGAINAEDLEASLLDPQQGQKNQAAPGPSGAPPPGFGAIQLGHILSQLGPPVRPPGQSLEELQAVQRHLQSLGLPPTGLLGGLLPGQEPHLLGFGPPGGPGSQAQDPLGMQSLASLGPPGGPMMMPMLPLGLPPMGLLPFSQAGPVFGASPPSMPPNSSPSPWPPGPGAMFGGPVPPFAARDTGFPSSVLFPGDLRHPLAAAEQGPTDIQELVSGSPSTPPTLGIHTFDFED